MAPLKKFLEKKGYIGIPLSLTSTNHFELKAFINGTEGSFILDTGASNTCIGLDDAAAFGLTTKTSKIKAAGAGATNMHTLVSKKNHITIGVWERKKHKIVLFDLTHVNQALTSHQAAPVHGIIGADLLKKGKAIIDYRKKRLYLKKKA